MIVLTGPPHEWEVGAETAVTIGVYDGVHVGHRRVIADLIEQSSASALSPSVLTFDPHPLSILAPDRAPRMLTTVAQRIDQFRRLGVEIAGVLWFPDIRNLVAEEFCELVLAGSLRARRVVVGADFKFGRDRGGDAAVLSEQGKRLGYEVSVVDMLGDPSGVISSTRVRQFIGAGDVREAARMLGRPFELTGLVTEGEMRGRVIGFPTANLAVPPQMQLPARGVYAGWATVGKTTFRAAVNVGIRPTFEGDRITIEAHLLSFEGDLYGQNMAISFVERLREEQKFAGVEALISQIQRDVERVEEVLQ